MLASILIRFFNRESFIEACVESALAQTHSDLDVVIVDNRSTYRTWEICQTLARRDSRIRIFRNDSNIGPVRNWRRCIDEAVGLVLTAADIEGQIEYMWEGRNGTFPRCSLRDMMFNGRLPVSPGAAPFRIALETRSARQWIR